MINDEEEEFLIADQFDSQQSEPPSCQISSSSNNQESEQYSQSDSHSQDSQESHSNSTAHSKSKKRRYEYDLVERLLRMSLLVSIGDQVGQLKYQLNRHG
jgi:hypothetical protein